MRDIKFRAKFVDTNEWIYGGGVTELSNGKLAMFHLNDSKMPTLSIVVPETVGQFTGLKDKSGQDIYEGDIVAIDMWQGNEHGYISEDGVIKWHDESSAFKWFSGDPSDGNNYWLSQADSERREVIGNIYENPNLLTD